MGEMTQVAANDEIASCYDNCVKTEISWIPICLMFIFLFFIKVIYPILMLLDVRRERKRERNNWK